MRLLLHDYAGHPFQAGLARALAARGHAVTHAFFAADPGPKGDLARRPDDPPGLAFLALGAGIDPARDGLLRRWRAERAYGRVLAGAIAALRPDAVLSGNTPVAAQEAALAAARRLGIPFVHWVQDLLGPAAARLLARRLPLAGPLAGAWLAALERRQFRRAARLVLIDAAFRPAARAAGVPPGRIAVIPNWGPLAEIPLLPRDNGWAAAQGLGPGPRLLHAGTLGLKQEPELLLALARAAEALPGAEVIVAGSGSGMARLSAAAPALPRLRLLPLQPVAALAPMLAAADLLLATLGAAAGACSVPSKVLAYLCAGRPVLLAAPAENPAARLLGATGAGRVTPPGDGAAFAAAALALAADPAARAAMGRAGRAHAEAAFDIAAIAARFEAVLAAAAGAEAAAPARPMAARAVA